MKKTIIILLGVSVLITTLLTTGCVTAKFAPADTTKVYPPRVSPRQIKVFRSQVPRRPYIEIGSVHACCSDDPAYLVRKLKEKAAEAGGDAIIDLEPYPEGMSATVIRFKKRRKYKYHRR